MFELAFDKCDDFEWIWFYKTDLIKYEFYISYLCLDILHYNMFDKSNEELLYLLLGKLRFEDKINFNSK